MLQQYLKLFWLGVELIQQQCFNVKENRLGSLYNFDLMQQNHKIIPKQFKQKLNFFFFSSNQCLQNITSLKEVKLLTIPGNLGPNKKKLPL